jgi:hypothetical protein
MSDSVTIDGVEIPVIAREKAIADENMTVLASMHGKEVRSVDKLLLGDDREIFQCVHPAKPDCGYTALSIRSVTAHQRMHSGRSVARQAAAEIEAANARAAELEEELNARKQAASDRAKKAAATRESRKYDKQNDDEAVVVNKSDNVNASSKELTLLIQRVQITANAADDATDAHRVAVLNLIQFVADHPVVDPQIIAKAKQYDVLKAALNGM